MWNWELNIWQRALLCAASLVMFWVVASTFERDSFYSFDLLVFVWAVIFLLAGLSSKPSKKKEEVEP